MGPHVIISEVWFSAQILFFCSYLDLRIAVYALCLLQKARNGRTVSKGNFYHTRGNFHYFLWFRSRCVVFVYACINTAGFVL